MEKQQLIDYTQISPETTEADFLSGRTGFALGFDSTNQTMVELWSEGFQLNSQLDATNELGRYCQAREQLAAYMQDKIMREYVQYGGAQALCGWYDQAMTDRRSQLIDLGARAAAVWSGKLAKPNCGYVAMDRFLLDPYHTVVAKANQADPSIAATAPATFGSLHVNPAAVDHVCAITGEASVITVTFVLDYWEEMELVLGEELPKLLRGWQRFRLPIKHRSKARYDPVGMVGTPIEHCVQARYLDQRAASEAAGLNLAQETQYLSSFNPSISIGFSEKGLQKIWKKLGI